MKDMIDEIKQEKKILKQLTDMREKFIQEEIKNGNEKIREQVQDMKPQDSPSAAQALRMMNKKRLLNKPSKMRTTYTDQAQLSDRELEKLRRMPHKEIVQPQTSTNENKNPNVKFFSFKDSS